MADYHLIEGDKTGEEYRVVFHIPVPDEMNRANTISLRDALKEDTKVTKTSIVPWVSAAEQTELTNGNVLECVESFRPAMGVPLSENRTALDSRFRELCLTAKEFLRKRYAYWKFNRNVPAI